MTSLYDTLGVPPDASQEEIKAAFRRQAKTAHPDANPPEKKDEAEEKFGALTKAYEVLSDEKSRQRYDRTGATEKPDDIEVRAEQIIAERLISIFNEVDSEHDGMPPVYALYDNAFDFIRKVINRGLFEIKKARGRAAGEQVRWKDRRPKFKGKVAERIIDEKIRDVRFRMERLDFEEKAAKRALELLETYEHEPDERPEQNPFAMSATSAGFGVGGAASNFRFEDENGDELAPGGFADMVNRARGRRK